MTCKDDLRILHLSRLYILNIKSSSCGAELRHTIFIANLEFTNSLLVYLEFRFGSFGDPFLDLGQPINF